MINYVEFSNGPSFNETPPSNSRSPCLKDTLCLFKYIEILQMSIGHNKTK